MDLRRQVPGEPPLAAPSTWPSASSAAMEGEHETPPILDHHLSRRNPKARTGWLALTPYQRRCHLLGIFYYQTPEARTRRAQKAVEEAIRSAEKL